VALWQAFPRISKAMDGLREAHMDVLVAVLGKACHNGALPQIKDRLKNRFRYRSP
jgi:hypothetical protein